MERFTRRELVVVGLFLVAAAGAAVFAWANFTRAFPEASLTFAVNRSSSRPVGETFLRQHAPVAAAALAGRRHAAIFQVDGQAKLYLEREVGLERMAELIRQRQVRPWRWSHRFFLPLDKEEVSVEVAPEGDVVGFSHAIPEERAGASLEEGEARQRAEAFLATAMGLRLDQVVLVESHREDRPARRDWTFTYERNGWRAGEATYRLEVGLSGEEVASYREFLKVPDAWVHSYQRLRSANETAAMAALFGIAVTLFAAVAVLLRAARRHEVRWRLAFGVTAVSFVLALALALNDLPTASYTFDTTESWGGFVAGQFLRALGGAGVQSLLVFIVVAAGEPLYRARFPGQMRIAAIFTRSGWRSKRVALGLILGYCLAALFIAYQVAFYLVGKRVGAWNPAEVPFDNLLNTSFPWLAVLFIGFYPAVSEEFLSRVFSIPLVERLTRSQVAAVAIPALIWGFAHANYPAQPFYIRGVEVSLAGILVGIVFYRFGVIPCLVWHYVVDAGYTSMLLVRSGNPYFVVTALVGTGVLLIPLAVALVAAWRAGGFVVDPSLDNAADPPPEEPVRRATPWRGSIAAPSARWLLPAGVATLLLAVAATGWVPAAGKGVGVTARPATVRRAAADFLARRGVDVSAWRFVVTARGEVLDRSVRRYLLEHGGVAGVQRFAAEVPAWRVRVFRGGEREEWQLEVDDRAGAVVRYRHTVREEAPGPALGEAEARSLAEASLRELGIDPATLAFKESTSERRPARLDYVFTFADPRRSVGEAEYLLSVTVQGDAVDGHERRIKLPEAWERQRARATVWHYALIAVRIGALAWLVVTGLLALARAQRAGTLPWRPVWMWAGAAAVVMAAAAAVSYPLLWQEYVTAWPIAVFRTWMLIGLAIGFLLKVAGIVLALAALVAAQPIALGACDAYARRRVAASSVGAALMVVGVTLLWGAAVNLARSRAPQLFPDAPVELPTNLATALPVVAGLGNAVAVALLLVAAVGVAAHLVGRTTPGWQRWLFLAAATLAAVPTGADATAGELACGLLQGAALVALAWVVVRFVLARNPVAYLLAALWTAATRAALPLLGQPGANYAVQGALLLALAAGAGLLWLYGAGRSGTPEGAVGGTGEAG
jgi:membrane protease YdiL (CAAX protease family)